MKFSAFALAAAVLASTTQGFAGPQMMPRFAVQVRAWSFRKSVKEHVEIRSKNLVANLKLPLEERHESEYE
jgi:hypothetical protein